MRALVVDDSKAMRVIIGRMMREVGFETVEAVNGREALEHLHRGPRFDLALLDWNMPEMNGIELLRTVRADHAFDAMRVVMVTTESETSSVDEAMEAGADDYVIKPFTRELVLEKLGRLGLAA